MRSDNPLEHWLRTEVAAAYDEMKADPSRGRSIAQVRASLAAQHERAKKARVIFSGLMRTKY